MRQLKKRQLLGRCVLFDVAQSGFKFLIPVGMFFM